MKDLATGIEILNDTISNKKRHRDYDRVVALAEKYKKLFTGEGVETLLKKFAKREDDEMFEQRKEIYQSVMPAVASNLSRVFVKPTRSNRVYASVETTTESNAKARDEVIDRMQNFYSGESESGVDAYLRSRWFDLVRLDPNAFTAVEFLAFDSKVEKAKPYPVEYSSSEVINFAMKNGILEWLIVQLPVKYKVKSLTNASKYELKDGVKYILYLENDSIVYTQVDAKGKYTDIVNPVFETLKQSDGEDVSFVVEVFSHKAGMVPVTRVGYETDPVTDGRTCVSIFHAALPFFMKELKAGSELDISMSLHVFQQKIQYAPRCSGSKEKNIPPCRDGRQIDGGVCPACNGTGFDPIHKTGQDIILVPFPREGEPLMDLDKLISYKGPIIDLVKFQDEYVDRLTEKARKAIFGGTTMIQKTGLQTATEADYAMDDIYDTLHPFASKYSALWLFYMELIAVFTDNKDKVKVYHKFPTDFKMKTLQQLYSERKEASDAGLPQYVIDAIDIDIQEILYADDQDTLTKIKIKQRFMPFSGKSREEVTAILTLNKTTEYFAALYTHFEIIFDQIDTELGEKFYLMALEKQQAEVRNRVNAIIAEMRSEKSARLPIPIETDETLA